MSWRLPARHGVWRLALRFALTRRIAGNAAKIALVVGTLLNAINQGGAVLAGGDISLVHLALNYLVPYAVATYSAVQLRLQQLELARGDADPGDRAPPPS